MQLETIDIYRPMFSPWLIAALLVAGTIATLALYRHAARAGSRGRATLLALLRLIALAAVAWVLAGPSVLRAVGTSDRLPRVTILADTSASMAERDVGETWQTDSSGGGREGDSGDAPPTRWDALAATWLDGDFLRTLDARAHLQLRRFDQTLRPLDIDRVARLGPDGSATHLFEAIDRVAEDSELIVVLSDGRDTGRARAPAMDDRLLTDLPRRGVTVFAVPVGRPHHGPHLALHAWPEADVLYEGQSTVIHASIAQHGHDDGSARVELRRDGRLVDEQHIDFDERPHQRVRFDVTPPGPGPRSVVVHDYELRVEPTDAPSGDNHTSATPAHQRQHVFLQVSRQRIRVALFEGEPYWDTRFLARVLQRDPRIELTALHALGEHRRVHVTDERASPLDADAIDQDALNNFDVVILGKRIERFFPGERAGLLREFVQQRGGALVLARGRPFDVRSDRGRAAMAALEPVVPVTWGEGAVRELRLALTPEGRRSPLIAPDASDDPDPDTLLTALPGMIAATRVERARAASVVLLDQHPSDAATPAMAGVVHGRSGRGHVLAVLTDGLWRWALLPPREGAGGGAGGGESENEMQMGLGVYETFWRRALRWLAADGEFLPGQDVSLTLERTVVEPGQTLGVTVATRRPHPRFEPTLTLITPDGEARPIALQRADDSAMRWRATLRPSVEGVHRLVLHAPASPELIDPEAPLVAPLAVRSRSIETLDTAARPETLEALTAATGGAMLELDQRDRLLAHVEGIYQARGDAHDHEPQYAFARWPVLAIIALCLGGEWMLRRRAGWV